jgi:hypothetical protein
MFARRQFEHGDSLSQRTLRLRHTTQLRNLDAMGGPPWQAGALAFFSEPGVESATGDMLHVGSVNTATWFDPAWSSL